MDICQKVVWAIPSSHILYHNKCAFTILYILLCAKGSFLNPFFAYRNCMNSSILSNIPIDSMYYWFLPTVQSYCTLFIMHNQTTRINERDQKGQS
jgi:hypothetical protein